MAKIVLIIFVCWFGLISADNVVEYKKGESLGNWYWSLNIEPKSWNEALLVCQSQNATLAVINSEKERQLYVDEMAKHLPSSLEGDFNKETFAVGIHKHIDTNDFVAVDGTPLEETGYAKWAPNQPSYSNNEEFCVGIFRDGTLNDFPCGTPVMFFCEKWALGENSPTDRPICQKEKWGYNVAASGSGRLYKASAQKRSWDLASLDCQSQNANLATITSEDELKDIRAEIAHSIPNVLEKDIISIGAHARFDHTKWMNLDGTPLQYTKWAPGQPSNSNDNEHCASIFFDGTMNDIPCHKSEFYYVCEKPIGFTSLKEIECV